MERRIETVTDTELAILRELWERGHATIREVTDAIYREGTAPQYATVQKLLERLEAKECVVRDRSTRAHRFRAIVSRDEFIGSRLQTLADKLCGGSLTPLLTNLVQSKGMSKRDRDSLRELIEQLADQQTVKRSRRSKGPP